MNRAWTVATLALSSLLADVFMFGLAPRTAYYVFVDGESRGLKPTWYPPGFLKIPGDPLLVSVFAFGDTVITGIDQAPGPTPVTFRPNPFDQALVVKTPVPGVLRIYDVAGREVYVANLSSGESRVTLDLPAGVYVWKVGTFTGKIVRVK